LLKNRKVLALEIVGTTFIIFLGTALHFTYALSGNNLLVGSFSAVNESVWEHLKLPFWPSLLWMLIEMYPLRKVVSNFFSAKTIGTIIMVVLIPAVFYSYTAFTEEILVVDIATFMIAVIVGQIVSYRLFKQDKPSKRAETIAIIMIALLAIVFITFTFYPPHLPIFRDSNTGQFGI
jgi:Family of unknown function (DUF6512)